MISKLFRLWIFGVLLAVSASAQNHTQLVTAYQYYFDTDPGIGVAGNGAIVPITPTANFNQTVAIISPVLSVGLHTLYLRVKDEFGKWSVPERSMLYVQSTANLTQNVTAYQYYFDTDPGVGIAGNGAVVPVTPTSNFNQTVAITTPVLSTGLHQLYLRTLDEFGKWSTSERSLFYVQDASAHTQNVTAYQYYFDTDPGVGIAGNGAVVQVTPASNFNQTVAITTPVLSAGLHQLYLRTLDEFGRWSTSERSLFYVQEAATNNQIIAGEYYIDTDPGVGNGISIPVPTPTDTVNTPLNIPIPVSLLNCNHNLFVRFKTVDNKWSVSEGIVFKNPRKHARVVFNPIIAANTVYFETDTQNVTTVNWNFGDATTATVLRPVKTYAQAGVYSVRLIGGNPQCPNDTMIKSVTIAGVRHLECRTGCNNGTVTMNINGGAFTGATTVKFKKPGFPDISPTSLQFVNNTLMIAKFNLSGAPVGLRDLEATIPGFGIYTLTDEFTVTAACNDSIALSYEGAARYRFNNGGAFVPAMLKVINHSGKDAIGVNVLWSDRSNVVSETLSGVSTLSGIPFFNNAFQYLSNNGISTSVMNFHLLDDTTNTRLAGIIIPKIDANSSVTLPLYVTTNSLALNPRTSVASQPMLFSNASSTNITLNGIHDYSRFLKFGIERTLNITVDTAQFNPCYKTAFDTLLSVIGANATGSLNISFPAAISSVLAKIASAACVTNMPTSLNNNQFTGILRETIGTLAWGDSAVSDVFRTNVSSPSVNYMRGEPDVDEFCDIVREDFTPTVKDVKKFAKNFVKIGKKSGGQKSIPYVVTGPSIIAAHLLCMSGSGDPNHKYGPGDNPDKIWLRHKKDRGYTIEFENVPAASAPAQTVVISDTLDAAKVDLASFRWGSIIVGNSIYIDLTDVVDTTVIRVINLQPAMNNKLLIVATYSPTTGIAEWKMFTTDLVNLQPTTNPLEGFLPPNSNGQGVGFVAYRVNYKTSVALGDSISNKATILFDENAPITTNTWVNRYDDVKPQSAVNSLATVSTDSFQVSWSGSDVMSGILRYAVFVSDNDGEYELWKVTDSTYSTFNGESGHKYEFYSNAIDQAGNIEDTVANPGSNPDAVTIVCTAPTAVISISNNSNVCLGQAASVILVFTGTPPWNYTISDGVQVVNGSSSVSPDVISITPTTAGGHTYTITSISNPGCSGAGSGSALIMVSAQAPSTSVVVPPINNLPAAACNGTAVNNINVPSVANATQYIWDGPAGTSFNGGMNPYTSNTSNANITFGNPNGSGYYIGVQAANACGATSRKVQWVRGTVGAPAFLTGNTTVCANTSSNYTCSPITGATSYLWTITGDATVSGTGTTAIVNFGPAWTSGTLCVAAQTSCFTSGTRCVSLTTSASPITQINGTFVACPGQTLGYNVAPVSGAASYAWTLPPGCTGSSATNSINVTFGATFNGGDIKVQVTSICGVTSPLKTKTINSGVPPAPASISGPLTGLCGQTVVYTCPPQSGVTFAWAVPPTATINSGQGTNAVSITFGLFTTGTVCITAGTACGTSPARCITVKGAPNAPGAITAMPSAWCANTAGIEFNVDIGTLTGSYSLNWLYPGASIAQYVLGGGNSSSLILNWLTGSGPVHVTASNACGSQTRTSTQGNSCREGEGVLSQTSNIQVYPNPARTILNVEVNSESLRNAVVELVDVTGKLILQQEINSENNTTQLDVSKIAKGVYLLKVNSDATTEVRKVMIE